MNLIAADARIEVQISAAAYRQAHQREFPPDWYDWQHRLFEAGKTHTERLVLAANRCISPWTLIQTPDGSVPISTLLSETSADVLSWDGESQCVRQVSDVFLKGIEPMIRVLTDTGFFDCSRKHRVLTSEGWLSLDQLMSLSSGLHWWRKAEDWMASYGTGSYQYDQQLQMASGSDLSLPQVAGDARLCSQRAYGSMDAAAQISVHSRTYQGSGLLSIPYDRHQIADLCEQWPDPGDVHDALLPIDSRSFLQQFALECGRQQGEREAESHQLSVAQYEGALAECDGAEGMLAGMDRSLQFQPQWLEWSDGHRVFAEHSRDDGRQAIFFPCKTPELIGGGSIVAVIPIGYQPVLDVTVDGTACYFAGGVIHHNSGKTLSAVYEMALHITGDYPNNWNGLRINHHGTYWLLGVTNTQIKDVLQKELFGILENDKFTGGWIHPDEIGAITRGQTPGLAKDVFVTHKSGSKTHVSFKAYTQSSTGQASLPMAGSNVDGVLVDEQPPDSIIGQLKVRTMTGLRGKGGIMLYSMTPELGETELIRRFMHSPASHQALIGPIAWSQCPHLTPEKQAEFLASIPEHEREMRSLGVPFFGSGRIYGVAEDRLMVDPFDLSTRPWMRCIRAIDLGIGHPTSIAWLAFDPEEGMTYLVRTYRQADEAAPYHAAAANALWPNAPLVFPPDVDNREKGSGETVKSHYERAGINNGVMFENPDGSRYVEPGIMAIQEAEQSGLFRIFKGQCDEYLEERRGYHRDQKGQIVKDRDDTMDAVRYGFQCVGTMGQKAEMRVRNMVNTAPDLGLRRNPQSRRNENIYAKQR